ncbi:helix-hairpin-helix domain-containing protein [Kribbella sp. NPDC049174]|uniref:helix-hairpin-helix domain-containing protein n=1 Tax=Kribbella sp. NPDC049174 TaxID=3364112 RepID=UPI0037204FE8
MKVFRRAAAPDPGARERALARLTAHARRHDEADRELEERDEEVRGGWIPEAVRPERLRGARWTLSPRHVVVLAAVLSIGLAWAAWSVFRARPETLPDARPPTTLTSGAPVTQPCPNGQPCPGAQPSTGPQPSGAVQPSPGAQPTPGVQPSPGAPGQAAATVVVHVAGKVRRPGLVRAPTGSRVADVLTLAGGPLPGVDLTTLNLAREVTDGEQILVGQPTPPGPASTAPGTTPNPSAAPPGTPVNLNTATLDQLDTLPGVGPVLAQRILDYRTQNGPFTTIDQLQEVPGVGPKKFDSLKPHVRL